MILRVQKIYPDAKLPSYAHPGDAGLDLFAYESAVIGPGGRATIPTGIKMEIPHGYAYLIWDKSGYAFKNGITSLGGVIDAGYRGEFRICLQNLGIEDFIINKGDKIAQMLIQKVEEMEVVETAELSESSGRGENGFGSSGKI